MYKYAVMIDDNYNFMDEDCRYALGSFDDWKMAVAACRRIVDEFLTDSHRDGMTPEELYTGYCSYGEDPWISTLDPDCQRFSARDYAKERCQEICQEGS